MKRVEHPTVEERRARGKAARDRVAPSVIPGGCRLMIGRTRSRCWRSRTPRVKPDLVPVRHGRMMVSPFTFYRGAAKIMAADLKDTPTAGLDAQLCGDAHLSNFGGFASPERVLLFDLNDFDETLPGPFEYDVKRMAASFTIAARNNGFTAAEARAASLASASAYREAMLRFAEMRTMEIWYSKVSAQDVLDAVNAATRSLKGAEKKKAKTIHKAATKTAEKAQHPRQHPSPVQAGRARRRPVPDHQPTTDDRPVARHASDLRLLGARDRTHGPRAVPRLPGHPARRSASPVGTLRGDRLRPQGGRCRQRRHAGLHRVVAGPRRARPPVPAGQGSDEVGAGGSPAQEPLPPTGRTRRAGPTDDAGRQRHLPGLDQGRPKTTGTCTGASYAT